MVTRTQSADLSFKESLAGRKTLQPVIRSNIKC